MGLVIINNNSLIKTILDLFQLMTIQDRLQSQKEPSNLPIYVKNLHPYDRWNEDCDTYNHNTLDGFGGSSFDMEDDSHLYSNINFEKQQFNGLDYNKLILKYKGPQTLLTKKTKTTTLDVLVWLMQTLKIQPTLRCSVFLDIFLFKNYSLRLKNK
ncbi:hypothetical protein PSOL_07090 [Candidatus Phytoplasma solani]|uniref:hypothetical protein n=1 Tax=Candidatus Phytoplasma solani TaxID=69896 RepID=UPI0032DAEF39